MSDEKTTAEPTGASGGSLASAFGDWFDAQFPPEPGRLAGKTTDELLDMIVAGSRAQDELDRRQDRTNMERAALSAWMARLTIEADPSSTPQVPLKYPASTPQVDAEHAGSAAATKGLNHDA